MNRNLYSKLCDSKNERITDSESASGVFKKWLFSGCFILVLRELAIALSLTSLRWNDEVVFNLWAISLMIALFSLFLPCLICNPFNAKL